MEHLMTYVISIGAVGLFIWIFYGKSNKPISRQEALEAEQAPVIGQITGMLGGSINDAVTAQYALQRFEQQHGRKANSRDIATVAAMLQSMK